MDVQGDLLGEVAAGTDRPTQSVGERQQRLVAGASVRVRRQVAAGLPNHVSQNSTVVEVTVHASTIQYEHSHIWVDEGQQLVETSLTSRLFVSTRDIRASWSAEHM